MKTYIYGGLLAFVLGVIMTMGYYEDKIADFKLKAEQQYSDLLWKKIESEKQNQAKITRIENEYISSAKKQKDEYEKTISNLRRSFKPSGVSDCPKPKDGLPRTDGDSSDVICYRRDELLSRIEKTLDYARRCQELNERHKALVEMMKQ